MNGSVLNPFPTSVDAYSHLPYLYPLAEPPASVVKIPVAGPAPFTTLAVIRTRVHLVPVMRFADGVTKRDTLQVATGLFLDGFDPARPEHRQVVHSSSGTLRMMQISAEVDVFTDDNTDFTIAIDSIAAASTVSDQGQWVLTFDVATAFVQTWATAAAEISSWVLCVEGAPPAGPGSGGAVDPVPVATQLRAAESRQNALAAFLAAGKVRNALFLLPETLAAYRQYAGLPSADVMRAASNLTALSAQLATADQLGPAVDTQSAEVDIVAGHTPSAGQTTLFGLALAEGRHSLFTRLVNAGRVADALPLVPAAIADYRRYATLPDADVMRAAADLTTLSGQAATLGQLDTAVDVQRAEVDMLTTFASPATLFGLALAEGRHSLVTRLVAAGRVDEARSQAPETIADYQRYAALPGADVSRARGDLLQLSGQLARIGDDAGARAAAAAAAGLVGLTIRIDTGQLTYPKFLIPGITPAEVDGSTPAVLSLAPGTYGFQQMSGVISDLRFTVRDDGTLDYDPRFDAYAGGRGTTTLIVRGVPVTVDTSALSHGLLPMILGGTALDPGVHDLRLVPAAGHRFQPASGIVADFTMDVTSDGTVETDPRFAGFAHTDGARLTITGYPITLDFAALSHGLLPMLLGWAGPSLPPGVHELSIIPGEHYRFQPASGVVADFDISVSPAGDLTIDTRFDGFARVSARTVTIPGYVVTIDSAAVSFFLTPILLDFAGGTLAPGLNDLTLIPTAIGAYAFRSSADILDPLLALDTGGALTLAQFPDGVTARRRTE
ncbi:hypothetical protein [Cryptosporangium sp. NPDC051539]|uniref:hypothetical protein n=1 Tax=Cryptosporangium sp. NPDC051539 TaxID=3363962 RepID=UPI00378F9BB9